MKISKRANLDIDAQLWEAVDDGDLNEVKKFLKFGADPNGFISAAGQPCLIISVWHKNFEITELLLQNGVDVNWIFKGVNAIHFAAHNNDLENFKLLLKFGADINAMTDIGQTPLDVANSAYAHDIIKFIENYQPQSPVAAPIQSKPADKDVDFFKPKAPSCPTCGKEAPGYTCPTCGDIPFFADDRRASRLSRYLTKNANKRF